MNITKAMSDKNRVRIIMAIANSPMCVVQLTSLLNLAPSTTSKHVSVLQQAKIIESVRRGKWVFYVLVSEKKNPLIGDLLSFLEKGTKKSAEILEDKKNIKKILSEYCDVHGEIHTKIVKGER